MFSINFILFSNKNSLLQHLLGTEKLASQVNLASFVEFSLVERCVLLNPPMSWYPKNTMSGLSAPISSFILDNVFFSYKVSSPSKWTIYSPLALSIPMFLTAPKPLFSGFAITIILSSFISFIFSIF